MARLTDALGILEAQKPNLLLLSFIGGCRTYKQQKLYSWRKIVDKRGIDKDSHLRYGPAELIEWLD
jgi:hypothetical protein